MQQAFSALDRLEVRGRDSAGIHVFVWGHDIEADALATLVAERGTDPLFQSGTVVQADECLSFVYKAAAEIGELGDNTAALRRALSADALLRRALQSPGARVAILGHTRWASVGIISEPNTHPLNSFELEQPGGAQPPYVVAALNGDVDNHADLRVAHGLRIASTITTDAKVIPALVARHAIATDLTEAFRRTVCEFEGSVAIGVASAQAPSRLFLARAAAARGSTSDSWTTATSWLVNRTAWSRRLRSTFAWTANRAERSSCSTVLTPANSTASCDSPTTGRRSPSSPPMW